MINRKELRIGNYITEVTAFDGFYASVVSIGADTCIYGVGYTALFDKLAPIPLTEKWLLGLGFRVSRKLDQVIRYDKGDYSVVVNTEGIFFYICNYMDNPHS